MLDIILNDIGWVVMTFSDGSKRTIRTTYNKKLLEDMGIEFRKDFFYDLSNNIYVPFREDVKDIEVFDTKPIFESEVLKFASRFI